MIGGMIDRFYRIEASLPNDPLKEPIPASSKEQNEKGN
jgi:hypothetical protein